MSKKESKINRWRRPTAIGGAIAAVAAVAAGVVFFTAASGSAEHKASKCDSWTADFSARFDAIPDGEFATPVRITSPKGGVNAWEVLISEGVAHLQWEDAAGADVGILTSKPGVVDQRWHQFRAEVSQSGSDIAVALTVDGQRATSTIARKKVDATGSTTAIKPTDAGVDAATVKDFAWNPAACAKV